jgi:hypothetical protein
MEMTAPIMDIEMDKEIKELLQQIVGELVWAAKRGHGTFITMEFGAPHLVVREPIKSTSTAPRVVRLLARRQVSIRGEFSLFIQDSRWSISTKDRTVGLDSRESVVREVLQDLDGQRVSAVSFASADTILEFDLGATVRLGKSIFPTEPKSDLWSLNRFGTPGLNLLNDGSMRRGDEPPSKEPAPQI